VARGRHLVEALRDPSVGVFTLSASPIWSRCRLLHEHGLLSSTSSVVRQSPSLLRREVNLDVSARGPVPVPSSNTHPQVGAIRPVTGHQTPLSHNVARLTHHLALSGSVHPWSTFRTGHASGSSARLSDVERRPPSRRPQNLVPYGAGVIVRTAAEGAAATDSRATWNLLQAQWDDIQIGDARASACPAVLQPDLYTRGPDAFQTRTSASCHPGQARPLRRSSPTAQLVSPDLVQRVRQFTARANVFAEWRIDEQILKGLDRKVFLPRVGPL